MKRWEPGPYGQRPRGHPRLAGGRFLVLAEDKPKVVRVLIETELGTIEVELDAAKAPASVANFLRYVDGRFYDGGPFHRTVKPDYQPDNKVKIEVVQAGTHPNKAKEELVVCRQLADDHAEVMVHHDGRDSETV